MSLRQHLTSKSVVFGKSFAIALTSFYNVFSKIIANFVKCILLKRLNDSASAITKNLLLKIKGQRL
jgi:hypothetical protein